MKCLLCSLTFEDEKGLLEHYISFHKIDESNWFFKKLFNTKNSKILKKCLRCEDFIYDTKAKAEHDFLNTFLKEKSNHLKLNQLTLKHYKTKLRYIQLIIQSIKIAITSLIQKSALVIF